MVFDPNNQLEESQTIAGKFRTLLTGPKYGDKNKHYFGVLKTVYAIIIYSLILALLIPILGLNFFTLCIGVVLGSIMASVLNEIPLRHGFTGLLAWPHLMQLKKYEIQEQYFSKQDQPGISNTSDRFFLPDPMEISFDNPIESASDLVAVHEQITLN